MLVGNILAVSWPEVVQDGGALRRRSASSTTSSASSSWRSRSNHDGGRGAGHVGAVLGLPVLRLVRLRRHLVGGDRRRAAGVLLPDRAVGRRRCCTPTRIGTRLAIGWTMGTVVSALGVYLSLRARPADRRDDRLHLRAGADPDGGRRVPLSSGASAVRARRRAYGEHLVARYNHRMQCRNCGTEIADKAIICYRCGHGDDRSRAQGRCRSRRGGSPLVLARADRRAAGVLALYLGQASRTAANAEFCSWPPGSSARRRAGRCCSVGVLRRRRRRPLQPLKPPLDFRHARCPPGSDRRARPAHRPDRQGAVRDRPPRDQRSAAGRQRGLARSRRDRSSRTTRFLLRDRNSRYGTYVNGEQVTERALVARRPHPARPDRRRRDGVPARRHRARRSSARRRRRSATCGRSRRCSKACARSAPAACSTTCWRWCWIRRSRSAAPSAASSCWRAPTGELEFKMARGRGRDDAAGRQLRHQPEDSRGSLPHRRAAHRRRPARRRAGQRAHGHRRARHPQRAVRAAAARALPRQGRGRRARSGASACCISTAARRASLLSNSTRAALETLATEAAVAIENARLYRETMEKARMEQEMRIAAEIQQALLPEGRPQRRVLPRGGGIAAVPIDRRRLLRLRRSAERRARLRARRRRRQGAAGGAPERDDAGHLRGAGGVERSAVADHQPREPGALPPRHRVAVRDADVRRARSGRPADLLQRRPQSAAGRRARRTSAGSSAAARSSGCSRARPTRRRRSRSRPATG